MTGQFRFAAVATFALSACSGSDGLGPAPAGEVALIAWGSTTVEFASESARSRHGRALDDAALLQNFLAALAGTEAGSARILHTACDIRIDPVACQTGDIDFGPYLDAVAAVGTLEFGTVFTLEDDPDFDIVIADFCSGAWTAFDALDRLRTFYESGGAVLVLADAFCVLPDPRDPTNPDLLRPTAEWANAFVGPLGILFETQETGLASPFTVPAGERDGLLRGVSELDLTRLVPLDIIGPDVEAVFSGPFGAMGAVLRR